MSMIGPVQCGCIFVCHAGYSCKLLTQSTALLILNENSLDVRPTGFLLSKNRLLSLMYQSLNIFVSVEPIMHYVYDRNLV